MCGLNVLAKCSAKTMDFSSSDDANVLSLLSKGGMDLRTFVNFFVAFHNELIVVGLKRFDKI